MSGMPPEDPLDFIEKAVLKHTQFSATNRELYDFAEDFRILSGSMVVLFSEVSLSADFITTRAAAGLDDESKKLSEILGFPLLKTSYNLDPRLAEAFQGDRPVEYASLCDLTRHQIPEDTCNHLSRIFHIGRVWVLGLKAEGILLGHLIFILKKGQDLLHPSMVELFGRHMALFLLQFRRCQTGFLEGITDRTESEQTGQVLVQSFYKATERIPDLVYQLDTAGCFVFINHAIERYGYFRDDLMGHSILEIVHPEDREKTHWNLQERRTGNRKTIDVEVRFITGKSKTVYFSVTEKESYHEPVVKLYAEGLYDDDREQEQFLGTLGICRDITLERDLEIRLNNQVEAFRIIAEHTDDAIWLEQVDPPRILYSNEAARRMVGRVKTDIRRNVESYSDLVYHDDLVRVRGYFQTLDSLSAPSEIEFRILSDWDIRWILLRFFPVYYHNSVTNKRVGMASDITKQKDYQKDLLSRIEKEKAYMKELNHRVKNNLAMIQNMIFLEIMALPEDAGQTKSLLSDIRGRIRSIGLVHQMLYDMSSEGMIEINEYLRVLGAAIVKSGVNLQNAPILECHLSGKYWMPMEDIIPIGMITNEFITNALKYAFPEKKDGVIRLRFQEESEGRFLLAVGDNGIPLPEENEKLSSSGIGMVLVEALVKQLDGEYETVCENGEKFFVVRFPSRVIRHRR